MARSPGPVGASSGRLRGSYRPDRADHRPPSASFRPLLKGLGAASLLVGCLGALALLFPEGRLTAPLQHWLRLGFGWSSPLAPLWLILAGALVLTRSARSREQTWPRMVGLALFSLAVVPAAHLLPIGAGSSLARAQSGAGGGWAGHLLAQALLEALGGPATAVALAGLLAVGVLLVANVGAGQVLVRVGATARRLGQLFGATARALFRLSRPRGLRVNQLASATRPPQLAHRLVRLLGADSQAGEPAASQGRASQWRLPPLSLFSAGSGVEISQPELRLRARVIEETLASFNIEARVVEVNPGPAVTQFGLEPAAGVAVSRVLARSSDLALRLAASPIRLEAPVPGKRVIGLEVPNSAVSMVNIRELLESDEFRRLDSRLGLALGRDVSGRPVVGDLARMPHLLIAGATGSGKSVCINAVVASLLVQCTPQELQFLMIDPKMVELAGFSGLPHLRMPIVTDMERVVGALKWAVREMERRYGLFARTGVRNLEMYNRDIVELGSEPRLPSLVVVVDELADMMMTAAEDVERTLCRLAQLGRAAGVHLVVATQRPSVDVLTGLIKANFVTRIAFAVSAQVDSRVILDTGGAEKLLGRGDMLYLPAEVSKPVRLQGAYVSDQEIQDLVGYWRGLGSPRYSEHEVQELSVLGRGEEGVDDELYARAEAVARQYTRISASLLQRRLGIGYPRAARLVDLLELRGVAGPAADGKSREVQPQAPAEGP